MKEGMIRLTGKSNLYYDSTTKQYKSRMYCPCCGKSSGCWCYPDFESIPLFEDDYPNTYCSNRCFVLDTDYDVQEIAISLGITIKSTMEEWSASKIVKVFMEDFDGDDDIPSGEVCEL